jgi:MFS family permease
MSRRAAASGPTEAAESKAFSFNAFLSIYLPAMVLALGAGIALPAIPVLAKSFHVTFGVASFVVISFVTGNVAGSIPTGWLIDRYGRRKIMLIGPIVTSAMAIMVGLAHTFPELLIFRFIDGWAAQMWLQGRLTRISGGAAANQRGRQVSWMYGMDGVGRLSGPMVGGIIATSFGLRAPFFAYGALALIALIPSFMFIQDSVPGQRRAASAAAGSPRTLSIAQIVLPRLPFFGVALFAGIARGPAQSDLYHLYAAFAYNLKPHAIALLATGASCISLPISFTGGWIMDRFGRKRTMIPGFFGVTIMTLALATSALLHLSLSWYVPLFLGNIASQAMTGGSIQTIGADVAPPEARGMFLGLWLFVGRLGPALSPMVFAFLADHAGYPSSFVFVASAALVVAMLLVIFVPETSQQGPSARAAELPVPAQVAANPAPDSAAAS